MKIRLKLTYQYTIATAIVFVLSMLVIYFYSDYTRSEAFFRNLRREAVTKAHLYLSGKVEASTMQSVYLNNRSFIDEVEVAVYDPSFTMLYHDAVQIDIVKESPQMIAEVLQQKNIHFYIGNNQAVAMLYSFKGKDYIVTVAAYDGYGYSNLAALRKILVVISLVGLSVLWLVGFLLARSALAPVKQIMRKADQISAHNISERLPVSSSKDELSELSLSFNRLLDDLEKAFQSQKMFVSHVSHELRTPMSSLVTEAELTLLKPRDKERYEQALRHILQDAGRIVSLTDGLLNLAKADYHSNQIKMEALRLDELLLEACAAVMKAHSDYRVDLQFEGEADDDSVLTVQGNSYLLTIAFANLIENNCKFSADRTSVVHIGFDQSWALIRFSDRGIGIPEKDLEHLFTPFFRGENASFSSGHGIGMALVQKIIILHQGFVSVESKRGDGTTFLLKIPHAGKTF